MIMRVEPQLNGRVGDEAPLRNLINFLQRNRLLIVGLLLPVLAATLLFLRFARPVYEAATSLRIDQQRSDVAVLDVLKNLSSGSEIDTEMEELRSRTLAEDVVDSLGLQLGVVVPKDVPRRDLLEAVEVSRAAPETEIRLLRVDSGAFELTTPAPSSTPQRVVPGETVQLDGVRFTLGGGATQYEEIRLGVDAFHDAVRDFADRRTVSRPNRDADFVVVRYEGPDSVLVRQVANAVGRLFISRRNVVRKREALSTVAFLQEQLDTLTRQLRTAEDALREFREDEQIVSPEAEAEAFVTHLADLRAQRDLLAIERDGLQTLFADVAAEPAAAPDEPSPYRRLMGFPTLIRN
ncbi:MAG: Wzz/FepE/Etk N-terminal domain-containing protein, partial [Longimicrobiales bacterium]